MPRLLCNADDFGISSQRDEGILQAIEAGVVRSVTVLISMVAEEPSPTIDRLLRLHAAQPRGISIGLHLNLTEGRPVLDHRLTGSICSSDGLLLGKFGFRQRVDSLLQAPETEATLLSEIAEETRAQLDRFCRVFKQPPSHVDGHQHVHVLPGVAPALASVLQRCGVTRVRLPEDTTLPACQWMTTSERMQFLTQVSRQAREARSVYASRGVQSTSHFIGLALMGTDCTLPNIAFVLERILQEPAPPQTVEWMCHPGYAASEGDEFNQSSDRDHELAVLCSKSLQLCLEQHGFALDCYDGL